MKCEYCGGETAQKKVRKHHWFKRNLYIIENVDAQICSQCGERYYHAKTLDEIDNLLSSQHPVKERLAVEVVSLST